MPACSYGMDMNHTAQLVLSKSTDDGKTWSEPINITDQVKDSSSHHVMLPFTRLLSGPMDYTPGTFDILFQQTKDSPRWVGLMRLQVVEC